MIQDVGNEMRNGIVICDARCIGTTCSFWQIPRILPSATFKEAKTDTIFLPSEANTHQTIELIYGVLFERFQCILGSSLKVSMFGWSNVHQHIVSGMACQWASGNGRKVAEWQVTSCCVGAFGFFALFWNSFCCDGCALNWSYSLWWFYLAEIWMLYCYTDNSICFPMGYAVLSLQSDTFRSIQYYKRLTFSHRETHHKHIGSICEPPFVLLIAE